MSEIIERADPLELPDDLKEFAFQRYGETPAVRAQKLTEMRDKIGQLPESERIKDMSDVNLIRFLRVRKFNVDAAVENTANLVKFEKEYPEYVGGTPEEFQMYTKFFQILENRDSEGRTIVICRSKNALAVVTPEINKDHPMGKGQIMVLDRLSRDPYVQVKYLRSLKDTFIHSSLLTGARCRCRQLLCGNGIDGSHGAFSVCHAA
jgi:hypothetical protein